MMSTADVGFYTAVATAIPAFVVAYAVAVNKTISETLKGRFDDSMQAYIRSLVKTQSHGSQLRNVVSGIAAATSGSAYQTAGVIVFAAAAALPGWGEYESLHALYMGHPSSYTHTVALLGAAVAGTVVLAPLAYGVLHSLALVPMWRFTAAMAINLRLVRSIYAKWQRDEFGSEQWAADDVRVEFADSPGVGPLEGEASVKAMSRGIWDGGYPKAVRQFVLEDASILVLDERDTIQGATRYEIARRRVKRIVIYRDRQLALADAHLDAP